MSQENINIVVLILSILAIIFLSTYVAILKDRNKTLREDVKMYKKRTKKAQRLNNDLYENVNIQLDILVDNYNHIAQQIVEFNKANEVIHEPVPDLESTETACARGTYDIGSDIVEG